MKTKTILKDQRGIAPVLELLLVIAVLGVLGFAGYRAYEARQAKPVETTDQDAQTAYERTTTVPKNWKTYTNPENKFSISHPPNWEIRADKASEGELSILVVHFKPATSTEFQHSLELYRLDLATAISDRKKTVTDSQAEGDTGIKFTITKESKFSYDGYKGARIDITSDDGTPPDSYFTHFFVDAGNILYEFNTGAQDATPDKTLLTVIESLKITN